MLPSGQLITFKSVWCFLLTTGSKGNGNSASVKPKSRSVLKSSTGTAASVVSGNEDASTDPSSYVPRTRRVASGK